MRLTMSGGFLSAFSAVMSLGVMLFSADSAASSAGLAAARSFSASSLTSWIACLAAQACGHTGHMVCHFGNMCYGSHKRDSACTGQGM